MKLSQGITAALSTACLFQAVNGATNSSITIKYDAYSPDALNATAWALTVSEYFHQKPGHS
jgi:hypothetical protein